MKQLQSKSKSRNLRRPQGIRPAFALSALAMLPLGPIGLQDDGGVPDSIDRTRNAMRLWVETRQMISAEERDWRLGKELLESEIAATRNEIARQRRDIEEARSGVTENDRKRLGLIETNDALKASAEGLEEIVGRLEAGVRGLVPRIPGPLADRDVVRGLITSLGDGTVKSKSSLADRYLVVVGILTALDKFNREVSESRETLVVGDRPEAEYNTIYIGLGQAYFLSRENDVAGVGRPGPEGWSWMEVEESDLPDVIDLMKVVRNEIPARYVELPLVIN